MSTETTSLLGSEPTIHQRKSSLFFSAFFYLSVILSLSWITFHATTRLHSTVQTETYSHQQVDTENRVATSMTFIDATATSATSATATTTKGTYYSTKSITSPSLTPSSPLHPVHWGYVGADGPTHWGDLSDSYRLCQSGQQQSPIDLSVSSTTEHIDHSLSTIQFNYSAARMLAKLPLHLSINLSSPVESTPSFPNGIDELYNNGHTIQINYEPGSSIQVQNQSFDLSQFHFHSPSEHTLDGDHFDMEVHLVHTPSSYNRSPSKPFLTVLGIWMKLPEQVTKHERLLQRIYDGHGHEKIADSSTNMDKTQYDHLLNMDENQFIASLDWNQLPTQIGYHPIGHHRLNILHILPTDKRYFHYNGSLTTPPCTENVSWYLFRQPITISLAQKLKFRQLFQFNARPTQPLHHRQVTANIFN